jgi:hypothetical protein
LSLDEACGLVVAFAGFGPAGGTLAGPFVFDVDDRQPQQLDDGVVGREVEHWDQVADIVRSLARMRAETTP